ncbi:PREDICTED: epidermal retinol dehydrogenase 2-like isoform X2 [Papilio polytes]|uniref:epidermal retinol dehydrogenase 2-like isoform X2 n=1 Tax=Papilio polytes TaxID=76194 RepID=UPI000675BCE0|nr:PREDICTED: epidermal retinol dehydrogenase 2-like isoform X2 [Papilio polytes]
MRSKGLIFRYIGIIARKFRAFQERWLLPWWESGGMSTAPLWALDTLVLIVKLCSTCAIAVVRVLIPPTMKNLYGETVLITGSGQGLGRELALQFADLGATVICWDYDTPRNNAVVSEIRRKDGECFGFTIDVTSREQVFSLGARLLRQLSDVSIVIIQAFLPSMIEKRRGHIVAINSSAGLMPCADNVPYCAAKYGLRGLMDAITEELRLDTWTKNIYTTSVYLATLSTGSYLAPAHRFASLYPEIPPKEAAKIIIDGIRKNRKEISIPSIMKPLIALNNMLPYRIRIILMDFFNFGHRGWFSFC